MADSIQEQIVKKIVQSLSSVALVQRLNQDGVDLAVVPTILLKEGDVTVEEVVYPNVRRRMELFAVAIARQDVENEALSGGEILNALVAQIETAIQQNRSWDGLAIQTEPPTYLGVELDSITPHLSVGVRFEVVYQHLRVDPYNQ
jgi:hypothetical protein